VLYLLLIAPIKGGETRGGTGRRLGAEAERAEEALEVEDAADERAQVVSDRKRKGREKERIGPRGVNWAVRSLGRDGEKKANGPLRDLGR
jgi:hypothetical protein